MDILEDSTILKKAHSQIEEVNMDNVFEQVSEYLSNKNLNEVIMKSEAYLQADAEVDKLHGKLKGMQLSQETKETVDEFLDSYIYLMTLTVELAYRSGASCIRLWKSGPK